MGLCLQNWLNVWKWHTPAGLFSGQGPGGKETPRTPLRDPGGLLDAEAAKPPDEAANCCETETQGSRVGQSSF